MTTYTTYHAWCPQWDPTDDMNNFYWAIPLCTFTFTDTDITLNRAGHWDHNDPETKSALINRLRCNRHQCPPELFRRASTPLYTRRQHIIATQYDYHDTRGWQKRRPLPTTLHTTWGKKP